MTTMRAVVYHKYGKPEVLKSTELPKPEPGEGEVLVKVHAAGVTSGECRIRALHKIDTVFWPLARLMFGVLRPRNPVLGSGFSGVIDTVGQGVARFKPGDSVVGYRGMAGGAYAAYVCVAEDTVMSAKPASLSDAEAAAMLFGTLNAKFFLDLAGVAAGQRVMVVGASGAIGVYMVQLAKRLGAEVVGVCRGEKAQAVRALGADSVIDYTQDDFTADPERYDVVLDTAGKKSCRRCRRLLKPQGIYVPLVGGVSHIVQAITSSITGRRRVKFAVSSDKQDDLDFITGLFESGELKPVLDRTFALEQAAQAHEHLDAGSPTGGAALLAG